MDEITMCELDRLEAERKLRAIPTDLLESCWARQVQTEAVIDAILTTSTCGNTNAYAHARHVGEWAARVAARIPFAPSPEFVRRCGVLADVDPAALNALPETREFASSVHSFQRLRMGDDTADGRSRITALIVSVADEFDSLAFGSPHRRLSPSAALGCMRRNATNETREIVEALAHALSASRSAGAAIA